MKFRIQIILATTALASIFIGYIAGRLARPGEHGPMVPSQAAESQPEAVAWTCSMHPQIQQPDPGDCPICGMDLIPLMSGPGDDEGPRAMSMSESSRALAGIRTVEVIREFPEAEVRLVGKLDFDETREGSLSARFPARIDRLYVNYTGITVKPGEHLAEVYSPDLLTAQRELLTAHRSAPDSTITLAAREKLRLWDLLPEQVDEIIKRGEARDHFELKAPIGGVVISKYVNEGDYVKTGQTLFKIADLSELWLFLDAFESDLTWLRYGQLVTFSVEAYPGENFEGRIAFINNELDRKTRTISIRVNVPNAEGRLKPGMFARGVVRARMAEGGRVYAPEFTGKWISPMHPEVVKEGPGQCDVCGMDLVPAESLGYVEQMEGTAPLLIPSSAVLRTGTRAVVYVEKPGSERPSYEGREIVLGPRAGDRFIVIDGLLEGERVVSNGAFKIDSSLQIQAKPSMMNPEGQAEVETSAIIGIPASKIIPLMEPYLALQAALAGDNFELATESLDGLMRVSGHAGPLANLVHEMLASDSLEELRAPHFEILSNSLIKAIREHPGKIDGNLYIMHCPMAMDGSGADWIQATEELLNPYYGAMMLRCGEIREVVTASRKGHGSDDH